MAGDIPERGFLASHVAGNVCVSAFEVLNCPTASVGVANSLYGQRFIAHKSGTITAAAVYIAVSSGNMDLAIYNTAPTTRAKLYSAGSTAVGTVNTWQVFVPNLAVTEGDHFDVAIAADNATVSWGKNTAPTNVAVGQGTAPMLQASGGGGANKIAWTIVTSFPCPATLTESALITTSLIVPKIVVVIT
jgi:hypothetical protein